MHILEFLIDKSELTWTVSPSTQLEIIYIIVGTKLTPHEAIELLAFSLLAWFGAYQLVITRLVIF